MEADQLGAECSIIAKKLLKEGNEVTEHISTYITDCYQMARRIAKGEEPDRIKALKCTIITEVLRILMEDLSLKAKTSLKALEDVEGIIKDCDPDQLTLKTAKSILILTCQECIRTGELDDKMDITEMFGTN